MQISSDDMIGCATLPFTDLTDGYFDGWKEIVVPIKKSKFTTLSDLKIPELKLKVTVSVSRNKIDYLKLAESTVEVVLEVPIAHVYQDSSQSTKQVCLYTHRRPLPCCSLLCCAYHAQRATDEDIA
jgi:hypothetical protein